MEENSLPTDSRILYLLRCGEELHNLLDPEGITRKGFVSNLFLLAPSDDGNIVWCVKLLFESGDMLRLNGIYSENFKSVIECCKFKPFLEEENLISDKPENRLIDVFGDLCGLPVRLKYDLSPIVSKTDKAEGLTKCFSASVFTIAMNALFCGVDGGKSEDMIRQTFGSVKFSFKQDNDGLPYSVELNSIQGVNNGRITVSTSVDVYGLCGKSVYLDLEQPDGEIISCKCSRRLPERIVPSVKVAFGLLDKFSDDMNIKQRSRKVSMGTPKFK